MTITDADIEAARRYWAGWSNNKPVGPDGEFHPLVHAFADHRREALEEAAKVAKVAWLTADYNVVGIADADMAMRLCEFAEQSIRALIEKESTNAQ